MANTVNRSVNIYIQSGEAEKAYDRLIAKEKSLKKELDNATDPAQIKRLKSEIDKLQEPLDRAGRKVRGELAPSFRDLQNTVNALGKRLKQMSTQDADYTKVLVQYSAANVSLQEMKEKIDAVSKAMKNKGQSDSFFGNLYANLLLRSIDFLKQTAGQAITAALQIEGVRNAFNKLNQPGLLDNLRAATKGTVNDLELMKRAVSANNFQIPLERLGTLLQFAQQRARDTGQSVDYLVDSIVTGIARKSPLILDNLGINIKRINDEFKKTGDFAQAAFNVVDEEIAKSGPQVDTYADKVDRLKASFDNIKTQVGEGLLGIGSSIGDFFINAFGNLDDKVLLDAEKIVQQVAKENQNARDREIVQVEAHKKRLAAADEKGRIDLLNEAKQQIHNLEIQESLYRLNAFERDADLTKTRLDVWQKYYDSIASLTGKTGDTIANLQKEIQSTTEIRDNAIIGSDQYNQAKARLKELQDRLDSLLGNKKGSATKKENLFAKFNEQLNEQAQQLDVFNASQIDRDITANKIKYDKILLQVKDAHKKQQVTDEEYTQLYLQLEDLRGREQALILHKWAVESNRQRLEEEKKNQEKLRQLEENRLQQLLAFQQTLARNTVEVAEKQIAGLRYKLEVDSIIATGNERHRVRKKQLELERDQELANAEKTGKDKADIYRKFNKLIKDEEIASTQDTIRLIASLISQIGNVINEFFTAQSEKEQQQLNQERANNDKKKDLYKKQLDGKIISQKEYDKKVQQLDKQQEEREKQARIREFNRNKITKLLNATVNVAEQVASVIANPFLAAAVALLGAIQIGIIATQKPPKFAKGGRLDGPTHQQGGMPVINPTTGRKVAEVEGGEVILSRNTVRNNAGLVNQLLHSSMYNNGAPVVPRWKTNQPAYLNIPVISDSLNRVRMYAKGGVIEGSNTGTGTVASDAVLVDLVVSIDSFNAQLAAGIAAYTVLSQHEQQAARKAAILNDVTMKQ